MFVLHHRVWALVAPVAPTVVFDSGFPVTNVVVSSHDVACLQQVDDEVQIAAGMFAETVNKLDNAFRLRRRNINPAVNSVSFVERGESDFVQHGASFRWLRIGWTFLSSHISGRSTLGLNGTEVRGVPPSCAGNGPLR